MLGFADFSVFIAYVLLIASAVASIVIGIVTWNKEDRA